MDDGCLPFFTKTKSRAFRSPLTDKVVDLGRSCRDQAQKALERKHQNKEGVANQSHYQDQ
jgi:hypothetical protein